MVLGKSLLGVHLVVLLAVEGLAWRYCIRLILTSLLPEVSFP